MLSGYRNWQLPCHSQGVISCLAMVHRSCGQLGDLFLNKEPRGHLQWEQAAKVEASVQVPALVWLMVRVQAKHSSTWPPDPKLPRITKWLSITKAAIKGHHPGDTTQEAVLQPKPLINAMTPQLFESSLANSGRHSSKLP